MFIESVMPDINVGVLRQSSKRKLWESTDAKGEKKGQLAIW